MTPSSLLPYAAAFAVFPTWALEQFIPYPCFIEELVKLLTLLLFVKTKSRETFLLVILAGLSFGLTEAVFYQVNSSLPLPSTFLIYRLLFTVPMHITTYLVLYFGLHKKFWLSVTSVILAITIHYLFNLAVTGMI